MVTGTGADLRCLSMKTVHSVLKDHGYTDEKLSKLERWDKIDILREIANRQDDSNIKEKYPELSQYKRDKRMTTQMQKKEYQNKINKLFNLLIKNMQNTSYDEDGINIPEILSFSDDDGQYEEDFDM